MSLTGKPAGVGACMQLAPEPDRLLVATRLLPCCPALALRAPAGLLSTRRLLMFACFHPWAFVWSIPALNLPAILYLTMMPLPSPLPSVLLRRQLYHSDGKFETENLNDWQHSTMYASFMASGLVDLLGFYFGAPHSAELVGCLASSKARAQEQRLGSCGRLSGARSFIGGR